MARDSWESRRPCYPPQFPGTIASSCCCWPTDFGHVTTHTHVYTHASQPRQYRPLSYRNFLLACRYIQVFNANHDHATFGDFLCRTDRPTERPTGFNIDSQRCGHRESTACRWRFAIVPRIASINHVSREKTSTASPGERVKSSCHASAYC